MYILERSMYPTTKTINTLIPNDRLELMGIPRMTNFFVSLYFYFFCDLNWTFILLSETNLSFCLGIRTCSLSTCITVTKLLELKRACFVDPAGNPVKITTLLEAVRLALICSTWISPSFSSRYDQQLDKWGQVDSVFAPFNPACKTLLGSWGKLYWNTGPMSFPLGRYQLGVPTADQKRRVLGLYSVLLFVSSLVYLTFQGQIKVRESPHHPL